MIVEAEPDRLHVGGISADFFGGDEFRSHEGFLSIGEAVLWEVQFASDAEKYDIGTPLGNFDYFKGRTHLALR